MKKTFSLLLALVICLFLVACGSSSSSGTQEPAITDNGDFEVSEYRGNDKTETVPIQSTAQPLQRQAVELLDATHFSDGIAWVKFSFSRESNGYAIGLLDITGKITVTDATLGADGFGSAFSGGYSYINHSNNDVESFTIIDQTGSIVSTSPNDGASYWILAGGDGIFFVRQKIRSMETNEDRYGFINADGTWIEDPVAESPLVYGLENPLHTKYYYVGEQVFVSLESDYFDYLTFYNTSTGATERWEYDENIHIVDEQGQPFQYSNGQILSYDSDGIYTFDTSGSIEIEIEQKEKGWGTDVRYSEGIFFTGPVDFRQWSVSRGDHAEAKSGSVITDGGFYDLNGTLIIDFSKYTVVQTDSPGFYEFHDGVAAVKILGADGEYYVSHIDMSGDFLYEPIKLSHSSNIAGNGDASGSALYIKLADGDTAILNPDGTCYPFIEGKSLWGLYSTKGETQFVFCDGYAWCENDHYFVSVDGQKLITFIEE